MDKLLSKADFVDLTTRCHQAENDFAELRRRRETWSEMELSPDRVQQIEQAQETERKLSMALSTENAKRKQAFEELERQRAELKNLQARAALVKKLGDELSRAQIEFQNALRTAPDTTAVARMDLQVTTLEQTLRECGVLE